MRAPKGMARLLGVAYAATETKDAIDAIFEALPKDVQKTAPKTGRVMAGGRLPKGTPYTSTFDKAKHIYDNLDKLSVELAAYNLLRNHLEDEVIGRIIGGSERFNKAHLNGNRLLNSEAEGQLGRAINKLFNALEERTGIKRRLGLDDDDE